MQISPLTHIEQLSRQKFSEEKNVCIFLTPEVFLVFFPSPLGLDLLVAAGLQEALC